jgi:hypothetical protein
MDGVGQLTRLVVMSLCSGFLHYSRCRRYFDGAGLGVAKAWFNVRK